MVYWGGRLVFTMLLFGFLEKLCQRHLVMWESSTRETRSNFLQQPMVPVWVAESGVRPPEAFQLRVGFFPLLPTKAREQILGAREAALERQDQRMAALEEGMELGGYGGEIIQHRREQIKAELDWVHRLNQLQKKQKG